MAHRQLVKEQDSGISVCKLNEEELFWHKFEVAEAYLWKRSLPPDVINELLRAKAFWSWFNSVWSNNDKFINRNIPCGLKLNVDFYLEIQSRRMDKFFVNRVVMEESLK